MFECECMYMRFSAKVVLAEGQGRRERWGIKAGGIFVSRQGLCFPWVICKCMDQIKNAGRSNHFLKLYMSKLNGTLEEKVHLIWVLRVKNTYIF